MIMWIFLGLAVCAALIISALISAPYYYRMTNFAFDIFDRVKSKTKEKP